MNRCEPIISKFKSKTNTIKKKKKRNANDSAMNRNFPLILHRDILYSLASIFSHFHEREN